MPVKVRCAECDAEAAVPDAVVGRKVRCSKCGAQFVALSSTAVKSNGPQQAAAVTVVARRVGGRRTPPPPPPAQESGSVLWVVAAVFAMVLPVAGAAAFAYLKWDHGGDAGNAPGVSGKDGPVAVAPAERYGAIEIASKGVKYTCFEIAADRSKGINPLPVDSGSTNTNIVQGLGKTGRLDPAGLSESVAAARQWYDALRNKHNVPAQNIYVVGSSGLASPILDSKDIPPAQKEDRIAQCRTELSEAIKKALDKEMGFVTADEEAVHQIQGAIPPDELDVALLIDVGSGGTRGGYREGAGIVKKVKALGVKEFTRTAKEKGGASFSENAAALAPDQLRKPLQEQVERNPGLRARNKVYLIGGVVWVMATNLHPEKCDADHKYIGLSADDVARFATTLHDRPDFLTTFKAPESLDPESRKKVEKDVRRMVDTFSPEELVAGAEILKALSAELEFGKKELAFYRLGDIAWVVDYVAVKAKLKK
ncbi:MAG TPA: hypothetical protein VFW33_05525 [Gemmataceae bacterium]|nr:hypothetical protein [Gemmataceae bacterium]